VVRKKNAKNKTLRPLWFKKFVFHILTTMAITVVDTLILKMEGASFLTLAWYNHPRTELTQKLYCCWYSALR
jgi:hypothetical protein